MENGKRLEELKEFHKQLKTYQRYIESDRQLSEAQERYKNSLIEKLQRKFGALKDIITQLSGNRRWERFGYVHDIWVEGLSSEIPLSYIRPSLKMCIDATNEAIGKLESTPIAELELHEVKITEPPKAFIVHGGDSPALGKLKNFLEALGVQPLIVEEQPSEGRSVGENVDWYSRQADCAIILATKGDIDGKSSGFIPRGNVLMEIGKLQELFTGRIIYLLQAGTKFPTNVSEKVWGRFTPNHMDNAFIKIAKELKKFGILHAVKPPLKEHPH